MPSKSPDPAATETPPSLEDFRAARALLGDRVRRTPTWRWQDHDLDADLGDTVVHLKLELFQYGGTFKPRGALMNMLALDNDALKRGVTAVSAGNHAIAVSFAAASLGTHAKVVMPKNANPARVAICRQHGAEIVLVDDVHQAFDEVDRIQREEKRSFVHPFDGRRTILGTGTVGLELAEDVPDLNAVIIPIGGGGLCAGIATVIKAMLPDCKVYGVEPEGADTMHRSFAAGTPQSIDKVRTIADSLGAPHAAQYSFDLCRRHVDELVMITDNAMRRTMGRIFGSMKLAVEPAAAAAAAALLGPLRDKLHGQNVGVIVCGTNIDFETFSNLAVFSGD